MSICVVIPYDGQFLFCAVNNIAHVNCGQCRTTLMYPYGAPSVKCAICNYVTTTGVCQSLILCLLAMQMQSVYYAEFTDLCSESQVNTVAPTPSVRPTSNESSYSGSSTSAVSPYQ